MNMLNNEPGVVEQLKEKLAAWWQDVAHQKP
jgi:hypothetical protein